MPRYAIAIALLMPLAVAAQSQPPRDQPATILKPARVFDGDAIHEGWAVRVEGDRIRAAGPAASVSAAGATVVDLPGTTLLPGLVEGHSHVLLHPYNETKWDDQGISWKLPSGWKKMDVKKETFNYQSPDNAFLLVNISLLSDDFPIDASMKAYYDQAMQQLKNGKYESVKMVEVDGIPGVEFTEAPPEDKSGVRRHQWIAYRKYLGQTQQLNVMTSTVGTNFEKHRDDFQAILYSGKFTK